MRTTLQVLKGATHEHRQAAGAALLHALSNKKILNVLDRKSVEPILTDQTTLQPVPDEVVKRTGVASDTDMRVGDIALAALIKLTRQDFDDYKFVVFENKDREVTTAFWPYFATTKDREAAFAKWRAWVNENPINKAAK